MGFMRARVDGGIAVLCQRQMDLVGNRPRHQVLIKADVVGLKAPLG